MSSDVDNQFCLENNSEVRHNGLYAKGRVNAGYLQAGSLNDVGDAVFRL